MANSIEPPAERRLFLIDGYAIIYRAFFAMISRPLTTSRGENTSAAWGVANFLQRLVSKHHPDYLGWVHDSGLSFRHEEYPEYKATREKLSDELQADFDRGVDRVEQMLAAYRVPILSLEGYEADDVIGTLARKGEAADLNVVVVSGDKDFHQLVTPRVWLLNPGRGGPAGVDEQWVGMPNASERLGVSPERVTDYLALVGDSSDNVPGVKGIGGKTAVALITQYGSLEEILTHAAEIPQKRPREALAQYHENARLSKRLVTIHTDLEVSLDLDAMRVTPPDVGRLRDLFVELEFHGLAKSLGEPAQAASQSSGVRGEAKYQVIQSVRELEALVERIRAQRRVSFDTETVLDAGVLTPVDPLRSRLVGLSLALAPGEAYYLPFRHRSGASAIPELLPVDEHADTAPPAERIENLPPLTDAACEALRAMLADPLVTKIGQNAKYDLLVLQQEGVPVLGIDFDTMIASYVLDPGRRSHGLDMLALEFLGHEMIPYEAVCGKGKSAIGFDEVPIPDAMEYSCEDVDVTLRLADLFQEQMEQMGVTTLFKEVEMPLLPVLAQMEAMGITVDVAVFQRLRTEFDRERSRVEHDIHEAAGEEFNINSNAQLRRILFEKLKLPVVKKTATGPSTDASVLERLAESGHALPGLIMEYRELSKLQSTYVETLPKLVNPRTGRLHTSFNQTVAATGRLSSSDPNLQNIPVRTPLGREIRRAFIPRRGWVMVTADYSQIELRLLAHLSGDPAFVSTFRNGGDIHRETAALIFGVDPSAVDSEMRSRAKTINFATIYGQGAHALSQQLHISHAEAKEFIDQYFVRFTGIRTYLDGAIEAARTRGYAETIFGRRRFIPELRDKNFNIRAFGERTAQNTPIQGSAADLIKIAMINIGARLSREHFQGAMLLQVHDELVFEVPPEEQDTLAAMVREEMEGAAKLDVPLVVQLGAGPNWVDAKGS
ncbi:MAG TPA: DNA polymerase I [Gemmatimonadaceae bacterium]|nr:DNA polymerase I [Gemmatimonadaceae bacterium]